MKVLICAAAVLFLTPACSNRLSDDAQQQSHLAVAEHPAATPAPVDEKPAAQTPPTGQQPTERKKPPEPAPVGTTHAVVDGKVVNLDAETLKDFKDRVDEYVDVHKKAEREAPPLKETNEPAKIKIAENALAAEIREQRADAKTGDIFTPRIRNVFRRLLYPELKGDDGHDAKETLKDDAPASVPYKVNADYPEGAPLPTVPANLLTNLPTLPKEVEYRIIGKNLLLRDVRANMIVDYMPNVIR